MRVVAFWNDHDVLIAVISFVFATIAAVMLALKGRREHRRRMALLELVDKYLENAFDAADALIADPDTPLPLKRTVHAFCLKMGSRDIARRIQLSQAQPHLRARREDGLPPAFYESVGALGHRPDLLELFRRMLKNFELATTLRWPETEMAGLQELRGLTIAPKPVAQSLAGAESQSNGISKEIYAAARDIYVAAPTRQKQIAAI